jgi:hypothetical protein
VQQETDTRTKPRQDLQVEPIAAKLAKKKKGPLGIPFSFYIVSYVLGY